METRASKHHRGEKYPTCVSRDIDPGCQHLHHVGPECQLTLDPVHKHHGYWEDELSKREFGRKIVLRREYIFG